MRIIPSRRIRARRGGNIVKKDLLLTNETAKRLYDGVKALPIYDYHCHLSPKEIYEDKPCTDIGELWLSGDHYKWRLMRAAGIDEYYITGGAGYREKFIKYAEACELAAGSPLYAWNEMELYLIFGIEEPLTARNAKDIYARANDFLKENAISPRKLIKKFDVRFIGTTDDVAEPLTWHEKIAADSSFDAKVSPSFRCDRLLLLKAPGYREYIGKLANTCGKEINTLEELLGAIDDRIEYFAAHGCRMSDAGIPDFPSRIAEAPEAGATFEKAMRGEPISWFEYSGFLGFMFVYLGRAYKAHGFVMQLHLAVARNINDSLYKLCGPDSGGDCIGDRISVRDIAMIFNAIADGGDMPQTVIYTLEPSMTGLFAAIAGSFRNVRLGAAWWFCDHKRGIRRVLETVSETGYLGSFAGMLTDSRSFLSYARHDYFRRILCSYLGELVESGEYPEESAAILAEALSCGNTARLVGMDDGGLPTFAL